MTHTTVDVDPCLIVIMDAGVNITTELDALFRYKRERTSFTPEQAHVYLLGCGYDVTFDQTKKLLKSLEELEGEGRISDIRADPYNKSVFVTHE